MPDTRKWLSFVLLLCTTRTWALWPQPTSFSTGSTPLKLSPSFAISVSNIVDAPQDLIEAASRTELYLAEDQLARLVPDRGASDIASLEDASTLGVLVLSVNGDVGSISAESVKELGTRQEGYTLVVPDDGSDATLTANSTLGLLRGLTTFEQIWYTRNGSRYTLEAPYAIDDAPAYPYRGLMLDTARNFFPVDDIKRTLDAMSWVKMSTFHWHTVDSQSFPIQVEGFLEVAEKGAYSDTQSYTPEDVSDVVSYANARGIDVIAEFDTPGHTSIISASHPEHIACPEASPWSNYAAEPPAGQLRIASNETTNFTANLIAAMSAMFTSKYFSIGGDEVNVACYEDDEETQISLEATGRTLTDALNDFTSATQAALRNAGKIPVVWEEMVLDYNLTSVEKDVLVLVWQGSANTKPVAEKGYKIVHAASDYFYLDCGAGTGINGGPDQVSWCEPFKTWQKSYSFDPTADLTEEEARLVLGGQQLLWTEQSSPSNLDSIVWPRAASSAEVFWTGPGGDSTTALARLHDVAFRFAERGVQPIALQPLWCALRPGACDA